MKLQALAVIFIIIILPISIVLSEYVQIQINTLNIQTSYDSKLIDATYDAVVAFQKNTVNSTSSTISDSKIRDIEASATTFLNSIASNFGLSGNAQSAMQTYIPAIVYTLYDGYYIYSPYTNDLGDIDVTSNSTYQDGETIYGLKPYIYYSREYNIDNDNNFVITYSLDNYIAIQGTIKGEQVNDGGYLIDIDKISNIEYEGEKVVSLKYRGVEITTEILEEYIDTSGKKYKYVKVNGVKYYYDDVSSNGSGYNGLVFSYGNNERYYLSEASTTNFLATYSFGNNNSAIQYYTEAYNFTNRVINDYNLGGLQSSNAEDWNGDIENEQSNYSIFNTSDIEKSNSGFNQERAAVIRYAIEKNLPIAIANYNNYAGSTTNFQMPELQEDEWYTIINNISVISFLQGMQAGTKSYNGYAIVTNNKNQEVVSEDSIYITTRDGYYHRVTDSDLDNNNNNSTLVQGVYNIDFERKSIADENGNVTNYYYPQTETGCYSSIVSQSGVNVLSEAKGNDIYEYLSVSGRESLAQLYYTALRTRKIQYV